MNKTTARTSLSVAAAAALAIPLTLLAAAPASAAPIIDVKAEFTTTVNPDGLSNTVTGTFTGLDRNNLPYLCAMADYGKRQPNGLLTLYVYSGDVGPSPSITLTDTDVPDDTYTIEWACFLSFVGTDGTGDGREPTTLVVPAVAVEPEEPEEPEVPVEPEIPEPVCTGSTCLPTGSFGF